MGIITDAILVLFFLTMCAMISDVVTCCCCCRKRMNLKFSEINIRFQIQAYLEMVLCICINLKGSDYWSFTNQIGILIYLLLTVRLLILSYFAEKIFTNNPENTLVLGLNPKRPKKVSQYLSWFFFRRIWFGITIIFLSSWPTLQIMGVMISSTVELYLILDAKILLEQKNYI